MEQMMFLVKGSLLGGMTQLSDGIPFLLDKSKGEGWKARGLTFLFHKGGVEVNRLTGEIIIESDFIETINAVIT
jgi:hypothetical protein